MALRICGVDLRWICPLSCSLPVSLLPLPAANFVASTRRDGGRDDWILAGLYSAGSVSVSAGRGDERTYLCMPMPDDAAPLAFLTLGLPYKLSASWREIWTPAADVFASRSISPSCLDCPPFAFLGGASLSRPRPSCRSYGHTKVISYLGDMRLPLSRARRKLGRYRKKYCSVLGSSSVVHPRPRWTPLVFASRRSTT